MITLQPTISFGNISVSILGLVDDSTKLLRYSVYT